MQLNNSGFRAVRNIRAFWVAILFGVVGLFFVGFGIYSFIVPQDKNFEKTSAIITDIRSETIGEEESKYIIVSYQDNEGVEHTDLRLDGYDSSWHVGSQITIKYNPKDPTDVKFDSPAFVFPLVSVTLGGIAVVASVVTIVNTTKRIKRKPATEEELSQNKENLMEDKDGQ